MGPETVVVEPVAVVMGPAALVKGAEAVVLEPSTFVMGPAAVVVEPIASVMEPSTFVMGPLTVVIAPWTVVIGLVILNIWPMCLNKRPESQYTAIPSQ